MGKGKKRECVKCGKITSSFNRNYLICRSCLYDLYKNGYKECTVCHKTKKLNEFNKIKKRSKNQILFHTGSCKKCFGKQVKEYQEKNKEYFKEHYKQYRKKNKGVLRIKGKEYHERKRKQWIEYIESIIKLKCVKCGYNNTFEALDFHHINNDKEYEIWKIMKKSCNEQNKRIMKCEIDKCIVLCATCHREEHIKEIL